MTERQFKILEKYEEPRVVESSDEEVLENFSDIGWVKWGMDLEKGVGTAVLTDDARDILDIYKERHDIYK